MKFLAIASIVLFAVGCGSESDGPETPIAGSWVLEGPAPCTGVLKFNNNGTSEYMTNCPGEGETLQERGTGTYRIIDDKTLETTDVTDTCPATSVGPERASYSLSADKTQLTVVHDKGTFVFRRGTIPALTGKVTTGCAEEQGNFTPGPVKPVK